MSIEHDRCAEYRGYNNEWNTQQEDTAEQNKMRERERERKCVSKSATNT